MCFFIKFIKKIVHRQNCKGSVLFQVGWTGLKPPVLQLEKNAIKTLFFLKKFDFCIFEPKTCEVIENSFKALLNFSPLRYT